MNIGDYVVRRSYNKDILFRIVSINKSDIAKLKGISYRILADAPLYDLDIVGGMRFTEEERSNIKKAYRAIFRSTKPLKDALVELEEKFPEDKNVKYLIDFIKSSSRGITR